MRSGRVLRLGQRCAGINPSTYQPFNQKKALVAGAAGAFFWFRNELKSG